MWPWQADVSQSLDSHWLRFLGHSEWDSWVFAEVLSSQISTRLLKTSKCSFQPCSWPYFLFLCSDESGLLWEGSGGSWEGSGLWPWRCDGSNQPGVCPCCSTLPHLQDIQSSRVNSEFLYFKKPCTSRSLGMIRLQDCTAVSPESWISQVQFAVWCLGLIFTWINGVWWGIIRDLLWVKSSYETIIP